MYMDLRGLTQIKWMEVTDIELGEMINRTWIDSAHGFVYIHIGAGSYWARRATARPLFWVM